MDVRSDRVPDAIEPIVGYRVWVYHFGERGAAELYPLNSAGPGPRPAAERWELAATRWIEAACRVDPAHEAPVEVCSCGFYAMRSVSRLLEEAQPLFHAPVQMVLPRTRLWSDPGVVLGRVELAGKVIEHEHGFRAERARIAELIPIKGDEDPIARLATRLGVSTGQPIPLPPRRPISPPRLPSKLPPPSPPSPDTGVTDRVRLRGVSPGWVVFALWLVYRVILALFGSDA